MAKTEAYSWRMNPEIRMGLEEEARVHGLTLAQFLDHTALRIIAEGRRTRNGDEAEQKRLQAAAAECFGTIAAGPHFSENVREKVRARVRARLARNRSA